MLLTTFLLQIHTSKAWATENAGLPSGLQLVRDLEKEWLVYNTEYDNYLPYTPTLHSDEESVSLLLNVAQFKSYQLLIQSKRELFIFIDGTLQRKINGNSPITLSCDSLYKQYQREDLVLTFYGTIGTNGLRAHIVAPKIHTESTLKAIGGSLISIKPKFNNPITDLAILVGIFVCLLLAIAHQIAPTAFQQLCNPLIFLSKDFRSELYFHYRVYHPFILVTELALCLLVAFLMLYGGTTQNLPFLESLQFQAQTSFGAVLILYLQVLLVIILLGIGKYFFIAFIAGGVFQLNTIIDVHFIKCLQSSLLFYGTSSLLISITGEYIPSEAIPVFNYWLLGLWSFYAIRLLILYFLMNRAKRFINLHLFSYLCIIEIMPMIIAIKFII